MRAAESNLRLGSVAASVALVKVRVSVPTGVGRMTDDVLTCLSGKYSADIFLAPYSTHLWAATSMHIAGAKMPGRVAGQRRVLKVLTPERLLGAGSKPNSCFKISEILC